jgi:hypothetical protein
MLLGCYVHMVAFAATEFDIIFSGNQPRQVYKWIPDDEDRRFSKRRFHLYTWRSYVHVRLHNTAKHMFTC